MSGNEPYRAGLLSSLFLCKGLSLSFQGVTNKETGKVLARTSDGIARILNNVYNFDNPLTGKDLVSMNYNQFHDFIKKNLSEQELNKVYDKFLKILDKSSYDIPNDLENYWLDNQERLELTGKYLPANSKLYAFRDVY